MCVLLVVAWVGSGFTLLITGSIDQAHHYAVRADLLNITNCVAVSKQATDDDDYYYDNNYVYGGRKRKTGDWVSAGVNFTATVVYAFDGVTYTSPNRSIEWSTPEQTCSLVQGNPVAAVFIDDRNASAIEYVARPGTRYFSQDFIGAIIILGIVCLTLCLSACCTALRGNGRQSHYTTLDTH